MVGLSSAFSDQHRCPLVDRVFEKIFQFAKLVSACCQAGKIISLAIDIYTEILRYISEMFKRCRKMKDIYLVMSVKHLQPPFSYPEIFYHKKAAVRNVLTAAVFHVPPELQKLLFRMKLYPDQTSGSHFAWSRKLPNGVTGM